MEKISGEIIISYQFDLRCFAVTPIAAIIVIKLGKAAEVTVAIAFLTVKIVIL